MFLYPLKPPPSAVHSSRNERTGHTGERKEYSDSAGGYRTKIKGERESCGAVGAPHLGLGVVTRWKLSRQRAGGETLQERQVLSQLIIRLYYCARRRDRGLTLRARTTRRWKQSMLNKGGNTQVVYLLQRTPGAVRIQFHSHASESLLTVERVTGFHPHLPNTRSHLRSLQNFEQSTFYLNSGMSHAGMAD